MKASARPALPSSGFSALELLLVLAVGGVLVLALIGWAGSSKSATRMAQDVARLRAMGQAFHLYVADHNQRLPNQHSPIPVRTLAWQMGFVREPLDWTNDSATPANSVFRNGADEVAIRNAFTSAFDERRPPDPTYSFASNEYIGRNPVYEPETYPDSAYVDTYPQIRHPSSKIYIIPSAFMPQRKSRFAATNPTNPFRTPIHPATKGPFPALFVDGHVAVLDPAPVGMSLNQVNRRFILPKSEP